MLRWKTGQQFENVKITFVITLTWFFVCKQISLSLNLLEPKVNLLSSTNLEPGHRLQISSAWSGSMLLAHHFQILILVNNSKTDSSTN